MALSHLAADPSRADAAGAGTMTIVSSANFLRGYGGVAYLAEALCERGVTVRMVAPIPPGQLAEARRFRFPTRSIYPSARRSPWLSRRMFHLELALTGPARGGNWLFSDLSFFREAVAIRRLRPRSRLVHYCTELLTPEEFPEVEGTAFYARHAGVPDLVIDVNEPRAAKRRERFGLTGEIAILPNTLPRSEVPPPAPPGALARLAGGDLPAGVPVLLYAGGTHKGTALATVVEAVAALAGPAFFLAFCHGETPGEMAALVDLVARRLGPARGRVLPAIPRPELLAAMHEAALGIVYYPYSAAPSFNQLHCAPTKVYEYMAAGLPIVASNNPTLVELVRDRSVGVCASDDGAGALAGAIGALLNDPARTRAMASRARDLFVRELGFERASASVIERIAGLVSGR